MTFLQNPNSKQLRGKQIVFQKEKKMFLKNAKKWFTRAETTKTMTISFSATRIWPS
jgi:hypothetical protein